jgi:general secretion pathway protein D
MRELQDSETEMFIFLTPTIITEPLADFERIKCEEMKRRPGDVPEFLCCLYIAREAEKNRVLRNSMAIIFGLEPDRCYSPGYWRPSTCGCGPQSIDWLDDYFPCCSEYDGQ